MGWTILSTPDYRHAIKWTRAGNGFSIEDDRAMQKILPHFFRSNKIASFRRQLNYFNFVKSVRHDGTDVFTHALFHRDDPEAILYIKRKENKGNTYKMEKRAAKRAANRKTEQLPYARPKANRTTVAGRQDHQQRRFSPRLVVQPHTDSAPPSSVSSLAPQEIKKQSDSPRYPFLKSVVLGSSKKDSLSPLPRNDRELHKNIDLFFGEFMAQLENEEVMKLESEENKARLALHPEVREQPAVDYTR